MDAQQRPDTKGTTVADPTLRQYKLVGGLETFANRSFWPGFFSRVAARKQWDAAAIDLGPDTSAWAKLPDERRRRLMTILAGFRVAEDAVAQNLTPFVVAANRETLASQESLMAWTFSLQRRDEERHARLFDRIAAELLELPGETPDERRAAAREYAPPAILELFEEQLPALTAELKSGEAGLGEGVSLYHMLLEGVVFNAGTNALLEDLADGVLPGVREGAERIERDERWHVGFGLRCLIETEPTQQRIDDLVARGAAAAEAWGDAVPAAIRERSARTCAHRLHVSGFTETMRAA
jgi:ribonucleoside-diphosphate reductase beta chain